MKKFLARIGFSVVAVMLLTTPGSASAVTHGPTYDIGYVEIGNHIYLAPDMDNILDGYDTQIASINTGLSGKEPALTAGTSGQYYRGDKTWQTLDKSAVGLSNVDNTSDASKPVSTATQTALNAKMASNPGGTTSQYVRGDGSLATLPTTTARSFNNAAGRSLTTSTGAVCFQPSATRDASVNYNVTTSTTATIAGASTITIFLEIAPTCSATAGDWVEISRFSNGQTLSLAVALQSVQTGAGNLGGIIPAGYSAKLRTVTSGTASATYNTGQEVLL